MTVKISGAFAKDLLAFNGLEEHRDTIVETEMSGDEWTGYAVCRLSVKQVARLGGTGEMVPTVQIVRIELMAGAYESDAKRMLTDTFKGRATNGVVDPVEDDSDFLRHGAGVVVSRANHPGADMDYDPLDPHRNDGPDFDPYENPDESPERHHGQPVERVSLPDYSPNDGDPDGDDTAAEFEDAERREAESATSP